MQWWRTPPELEKEWVSCVPKRLVSGYCTVGHFDSKNNKCCCSTKWFFWEMSIANPCVLSHRKCDFLESTHHVASKHYTFSQSRNLNLLWFRGSCNWGWLNPQVSKLQIVYSVLWGRKLNILDTSKGLKILLEFTIFWNSSLKGVDQLLVVMEIEGIQRLRLGLSRQDI